MVETNKPTEAQPSFIILSQIDKQPKIGDWGRFVPPVDPGIPVIANLAPPIPMVKSNIQRSDSGSEKEHIEREEISRIIIEGNHVRTDGKISKNTLDQIENERIDVLHQGDNMQTELKGKANANELDPDIDHVICLLRASQDIILINLMRKKMALLKRLDPDKRLFNLNKLEEFQNCGNLFIKINGISIWDVATKDKIDPLEYYKTVREAVLAYINKNYSKIIGENKDDPAITNYPETAKTTILLGCVQMALLSFEDLDLFKKVKIPTSKSIIRQKILFGAEALIRKTLDIRKKLCKELLTSSQLQENIMRDLDGSEETKALALMQLGLVIEATEIETYRDAKKLAAEKKGNLAFYEKLIQRIKEYAQGPDQQESIVLTEKDIKLFLTNEGIVPNDKSIIDFNDLDKIYFFPKVPTEKKYNIDPSDIDYGNFKKPEAITITCLEKGAFLIELIFGGENPKNNFFRFSINLKDKYIEWRFLDEFSDPKMEDMKNATMSLTQSILYSLQKQLINEQRVVHHVEVRPIYVAPKKDSSIHITKPKEKKVKPEKPITPIKKPIQETTESKGVRRYIDFPHECPKNLEDNQWKALKERLENYNLDNKTGTFKRLSATRGRISRVRVDEEYRVLVIENKNSRDADAKHYRFLAVVKRNDEYKELKKLLLQI